MHCGVIEDFKNQIFMLSMKPVKFKICTNTALQKSSQFTHCMLYLIIIIDVLTLFYSHSGGLNDLGFI